MWLALRRRREDSAREFEQLACDGPFGRMGQLREIEAIELADRRDELRPRDVRLSHDRHAARMAVLEIWAGVTLERDHAIPFERDVFIALRDQVREHHSADAHIACDAVEVAFALGL